MRLDEAVSKVIEQDYKFIRDDIKVDLQAKYFFNENISVFVGLRFQDLITIRSRDLAGQISGYFLGSMRMPRDAIETLDSQIVFSIPVGINMAW
jgi:hypothetical protein